MDPYPPLAGTEAFHAQRGELHCEGVRVADLADRFGTPLFVYSGATIAARCARVRTSFGATAHVCYAVKANGNLHLLRRFADLGVGFDLVSRGELRRLLAAGVSPAGAVMAGVAKDDADVAEALAAGILLFNVESPHEVELLAREGARAGRRVPVALRVNPDVDAGTHAHISTARKENKFGVALSALPALVAAVRASPHLDLAGYHVHLGSQVRRAEPYLTAFERIADFLAADPAHRDGVRFYDLGGGFAVGYGDAQGQFDVDALAARLLPQLAARGLTPIVEPGRYLIADAGILVTRVLGTKAGSERDFVLVDAAMNDLIRPALYDAFHPIAAVSNPDRPAAARPCDVVGPVCESGDFLGRARALPALARGDLLAVFSAGAYGMAMASNYNSRRRPAEVLVDGNEARLIRRRERFEELWAAEVDC
ncbi:MAG TPA: diaminopimelate decarboxylase [Planctomycetota bacterium]|nr:diaminopimelate decarboxylase [Planctomycetota bacterium]